MAASQSDELGRLEKLEEMALEAAISAPDPSMKRRPSLKQSSIPLAQYRLMTNNFSKLVQQSSIENIENGTNNTSTVSDATPVKLLSSDINAFIHPAKDDNTFQASGNAEQRTVLSEKQLPQGKTSSPKSKRKMFSFHQLSQDAIKLGQAKPQTKLNGTDNQTQNLLSVEEDQLEQRWQQLQKQQQQQQSQNNTQLSHQKQLDQGHLQQQQLQQQQQKQQQQKKQQYLEQKQRLQWQYERATLQKQQQEQKLFQQQELQTQQNYLLLQQQQLFLRQEQLQQSQNQQELQKQQIVEQPQKYPQQLEQKQQKLLMQQKQLVTQKQTSHQGSQQPQQQHQHEQQLNQETRDSNAPATIQAQQTNLVSKTKPSVFSEFPCKDEIDFEIETLFLTDEDKCISLADPPIQETPRAWFESNQAASQLRQYLHLNKSNSTKSIKNFKPIVSRSRVSFSSNDENVSDENDLTSRSEGSVSPEDATETKYFQDNTLSSSWSPEFSEELSPAPFTQHPVAHYHKKSSTWRPTYYTRKQSIPPPTENGVHKFGLKDHEADLKKKLKQMPRRQSKAASLVDPLLESVPAPAYLQQDAKVAKKLEVTVKKKDKTENVPASMRFRHKVTEIGWELRALKRDEPPVNTELPSQWPFVPGMNRSDNNTVESAITIKPYQLSNSLNSPSRQSENLQPHRRTASDGSMFITPSVSNEAPSNEVNVALPVASSIAAVVQPHPPRKLKPLTRNTIANKGRRLNASESSKVMSVNGDNKSPTSIAEPNVLAIGDLHQPSSFDHHQESVNILNLEQDKINNISAIYDDLTLLAVDAKLKPITTLNLKLLKSKKCS